MNPEQQPQLASSDEVKSAINRETAKARRDAFSRLRTLSNSFSKNRASHDRKVTFHLDANEIHELPLVEDTDRSLLFLSYQDKVSIADDVEETVYRYQDNDFVHPYIKHLDDIWTKSGSASQNIHTGLDVNDEELLQLVNTKGRGMEKKLIMDMKRNRDLVIKQVLDSQKSFKNLPVGSDQRAKMLKNKYKKLTTRSKVFALTMAKGDRLVSASYSGNTIAATSA